MKGHSRQFPDAAFFTANELTPPVNEKQISTQGIVLSVDGSLGNWGVFVYTVRAFHPVTHNPFILRNVRERVDQFYQNQAGRIIKGARVHIQRQRNGIWEITKVEIDVNQWANLYPPTSMKLGPVSDNKGEVYAYLREDGANVSGIILGDKEDRAEISATESYKDDKGNIHPANVSIFAGGWEEKFETNNWFLETRTISFSTKEVTVPGEDPYSVFRVDDPSRREKTDRDHYFMAWDPSQVDGNPTNGEGDMIVKIHKSLSKDTVPRVVDESSEVVGYFEWPAPLVRAFRTNQSVLGNIGEANPVSPHVSEALEWGPARLLEYEVKQDIKYVPGPGGRGETGIPFESKKFTWLPPQQSDMPERWDSTVDQYTDFVYSVQYTEYVIENEDEIQNFLDSDEYEVTGFRPLFDNVSGNSNDDTTKQVKIIIDSGKIIADGLLIGSASIAGLVTIATLGAGAIATGTAWSVFTAGAPAGVGVTKSVVWLTLAYTIKPVIGTTIVTYSQSTLTVGIIAASSFLGATSIGISGSGLTVAGAHKNAANYKGVIVSGIALETFHPVYGKGKTSYYTDAILVLKDGWEFITNEPDN